VHHRRASLSFRSRILFLVGMPAMRVDRLRSMPLVGFRGLLFSVDSRYRFTSQFKRIYNRPQTGETLHHPLRIAQHGTRSGSRPGHHPRHECCKYSRLNVMALMALHPNGDRSMKSYSKSTPVLTPGSKGLVRLEPDNHTRPLFISPRILFRNPCIERRAHS